MDQSSLYTNDEIIEIYNRNVNTIYKICLMYLKNIPDAEDAVQNIFLNLLHGNYRFENLNHEKSWLILTAQNHCKNILKHWWRKKRIDIDNIPEPSYGEDSPYSNVWNQILLLPNKYKIVIYLYYYEGYSTEEISKILNIKSSTIRTQLSVARKKLKIILKEDVK